MTSVRLYDFSKYAVKSEFEHSRRRFAFLELLSKPNKILQLIKQRFLSRVNELTHETYSSFSRGDQDCYYLDVGGKSRKY